MVVKKEVKNGSLKKPDIPIFGKSRQKRGNREWRSYKTEQTIVISVEFN